MSKNEYDDIVKKLIQSKKELRTDSNQTRTTIVSSSKEEVSREIRNSKAQLQKIQEDIIKNKKLNEELEVKIKKNEPDLSDSEKQKKEVDEELNQRQKELEVLKKKLIEMKKDGLKVKEEDDSKGVVEAASQIVATTNKRLHDTMTELDVTRKLLDKERKAHNETKKKLQS